MTTSRIAALVALVLLSGCNRAVPERIEDASCLTEPAGNSPTAGMVWLAGGTFVMGARARLPEEGPPRQTVVSGFWIDRTEVTNREFAEFVDDTGYVTLAEQPLDPATYPGLTAEQRRPSSVVFVGDRGAEVRANPASWWRVVQGADWRRPSGPGSDLRGRNHLPVVHIAHADALAYARWRGRDLPTEAEWEYAARGGLEGRDFSWGDDPADTAARANHWQGPFPALDTAEDGYKAQAAPVGCFPPNGFGLFDMAGNVWEWTSDWYRPGLDPTSAMQPVGPEAAMAFDPGDPTSRKHVIKGGSFLCADNYCFRYRPAARQAGPPDTGASHVGFRTVLRSSDPTMER